jgi:hypothetical protein
MEDSQRLLPQYYSDIFLTRICKEIYVEVVVHTNSGEFLLAGS